MNKHCIRSALISVFLSAAVVLMSIPAAAAGDGAFHIRSAGDWEKLAQSCRLDTWSQDKTVFLDRDIELSDFTPVPTFSGTFDGQGHTISGMHRDEDGDRQGLFRYNREGAVIRNLSVSGIVMLSGDSMIGGITGTNCGTIADCHFDGCAAGKDSIGGIAGVNEASGEIINCTSTGSISGEHYTGGIAGENYGSIIRCVSRAAVNTQAVEPIPQLEDMNWEQINSTENMPSCTDAGGIAGYSAGLIQNCTNVGNVGYPHIGYNIGGIAGRQNGQIYSCVNSGKVQGRKDVGGIAGQAEPYMILRYEEGTLHKLAAELDVLSGLLTGALDNGDISRQSISDHITSVGDITEDTKQHISDLIDEIENLGDETVDTVNDLSARISRILDQTVPVVDDMKETSERFSDAMKELEKAMSSASSTEDDLNAISDIIEDSLSRMETAFDDIDAAISGISSALEDLWDALGDEQAVQDALTDFKDELDRLEEALQAFSDALDALKKALEEHNNSWLNPEVSDKIGPVLEGIGDMSDAVSGLSDAADVLWQAVKDTEAFPEAMDRISDSAERMSDAAGEISRALQDLQDASPYLDSLWDALSVSADRMGSGFGDFSDAGEKMADALDQLHEIIKEQADLPELKLPGLDSSFHDKEDLLGDSLTSLGDELEAMNQSVSRAGETLSDDLRKVNSQFTVITDVIRSAEEDSAEKKDLIVDISEEDISDSTPGKIQDCINSAAIEGDVNVGGITGTMAVEFDFDPEDDISNQGEKSVRFQYLTRAVVRSCINRGAVTSRKDCAGGIAGRMDLGIVLGSQNYGAIKSTGGRYIGGIAGASYAFIRDCWAKCALSGNSRAGGIAGYASTVQNSHTLVEIDDAVSCRGAVAGEADPDGVLTGNTFVSPVLGGIDGISYAGQAEPMEYEAFMAQPDVPGEFAFLALVFTTDDRTVSVVTVPYGESVSEKDIPSVPAREGYYGQWSEFERDCILFDEQIEAEYLPWLTAIADSEGEFLAEGKFNPESVLTAADGVHTPPSDSKKASSSKMISLPDSEEMPFTAIRMKIPEEIRHPAMMICDESGNWQELPSEQKGSYLRGELEAHTAEICIVESGSGIWYIWAAAGGAVLLLGLLLVFIRRRRS